MERYDLPRFVETRLPLTVSVDDLANNEATAQALEAALTLGINRISVDVTLDVIRVKRSPADGNRGSEVMLYGHQVVDGLRVEGSDFSALVDETGHLVVFNGSLYRVEGEVVPEPSLSALQATQTALTQTERGSALDVTSVTAEPVRLQSGSKWIQQTSNGFAAAERFYDPETRSVRWVIQDGTWEFELEEETGVVVREKSLLDSDSIAAEIHHTDIDTGAQRTTPASGVAPRVDINSPYRLELDEGDDRGIEDVENSNGTEVSGTGPNFRYTNTTAYGRQQDAFFWVQRARALALPVWSRFDPDDDQDIKIDVDTTACDGSAAACFQWFPFGLGNPEINFQRQSGTFSISPRTAAHEAGHWVVYTYGDMGSDCDFGSDESDALDETIADIWATITGQNERSLRTQSRLDGDRDGGRTHGIWDPSRADNIERRYELSGPRYANECDGNLNAAGNPLKQVAWEFVHGLNCVGARSHCLDAWNRNSRFEDRTSAIPGIDTRGEAVRELSYAIAYALDRTGRSLTHVDFALWMERYFDNYRPEVQVAFQQILFEHGFWTPRGPLITAEQTRDGAHVMWQSSNASAAQVQIDDDSGFSSPITLSTRTSGSLNEPFTGTKYFRARIRDTRFEDSWSRWSYTPPVTNSGGGGGGGDPFPLSIPEPAVEGE